MFDAGFSIFGENQVVRSFFKKSSPVRASFVNWRTTENEIQIVIEEMKTTILDLDI
jgi:hypothetical protein